MRVAWNRVALDLPEGFRVAVLGLTSLEARGPGGTALKLAWSPTTRPTRARRIPGAAALPDLPAWLPARWQQHAQGFSWSEADGAGLGASLHDEGAVLALTVQAVGSAEPALPALLSELIGSLRLFGPAELVPYDMFGLQALVPGHLQLENQRFQPGRYRLGFCTASGPRQWLELHSLGPAEVLLNGKSIRDWAARAFRKEIGELGLQPEGPYALAWSRPWPMGGVLGMARRLLRRPVRGSLRVWQPAESNRMLVLAERGCAPQAPEWIEQLAASVGFSPGTAPQVDPQGPRPVVGPGVRQNTVAGVLELRFPATTRLPWPLRSTGQRQQRLVLDVLGSAVFGWIDGRNDVAGLARLLARRFQLHPSEAEVSVRAFLNQLGQRGIIRMRGAD